MSTWTTLLRLRQPAVEGLPSTVISVVKDNVGGLLLGIDHGDGAHVELEPLSDEQRLRLAEVLTTKEPW